MFQAIISRSLRRTTNQLFQDLLWRKSAKAYKGYVYEPTANRFRHVFEEILNRDDIWAGEYPGSAIFSDFDLAVPHNPDLAQQIAVRIIDSLGKPTEAGGVRLILAARTALAHDNVRLAEAIFRHELKGDQVYDADVQRLLLTMRSATVSMTDERLVEELVREHGLSFLAKEWVRHRWLYDCPSSSLLQFASKPSLHLGKYRSHVINDALALAFLLNDVAMVDRLLGLYPELERSYDCVLPLAPYLALRGVSSALSDEKARIFEFADLYHAIEHGTNQLVDTLRDRSLTVAIVGNSPCELGLGRGPLIDQHDVVTRFNLFSTNDEFVSDYGRKCSIHVRRPAPEEYNSLSRNADLTVLNWADLPYRLRNMATPMQLFREGTKLAGFPIGFHQPLYKELKAQPSAGLVFISFVKSVRGVLPRNSCFGFSFVDQVAKTSAHYFQDVRPSFKHRWGEELTLFERMTTND